MVSGWRSGYWVRRGRPLKIADDKMESLKLIRRPSAIPNAKSIMR
jgi:hypothetical protein